MCLAEAGYDPSLAHPPPSKGYSFLVPHGAVPPEICWRARELAETGKPKCLRCTLAQRQVLLDDGIACRATRRHMLDCGAHDHLDLDHDPELQCPPAVRTVGPDSRTCTTREER